VPKLRRTFEAVPAELASARAAVNAFCEQAGVQPRLIDDIRLAVSEACANSILHSRHENEHGVFTIDARRVSPRVIAIVVSDEGTGIKSPQMLDGTIEFGIGIPLIARLAASVEIISRPGHGTRVSMRFLLE
jgi:anti-sigma regulatory factor (Ser/Thr protein kinase)